MEDRREYHLRLLEELKNSLEGYSGPLRLKKRTASNQFRYTGRQSSSVRYLNLSQFNKPLYLDTSKQTLDVQGMTTYEDVVDYTLPHGFLPTIAPGLKHITVAGAIAGVAIESNCAKYGFAHDGLLEADVLLPSGEIVTCNPDNEYADLFHALPNSYGTLGYILRAKIQLRPATQYVELTTTRQSSVKQLLVTMQRAANDNKNDYVESLVYNADEIYLTVGQQVKKPSREILSIYGKTIFYKEASRSGTLVLNMKDYIFRYDPEWFWALPQSSLMMIFRRLAPKTLRNSGFYSHFMFTRLGKALRLGPESGFELLIQDWEVAWNEAQELVDYALQTVDLDGQPWLLGPIKSPGTATLYPATKGQLYLNLGCYAAARKQPGAQPYANTRLMDTYCLKHGGIKMLYSSSFMNRKLFDKVYNGSEYTKLKHKYDPQNLRRSLFEKATS